MREEFNRTQAREYCSEKYKNGSLWSLKTPPDCENFTRFMKVESKKNKEKKYWTGLCQLDKENGNTEKPCFMVSDKQLVNCNNDYEKKGVLVEIDRNNNLKGKIGQKENKEYFICQVGKGNKIFSWLIDRGCKEILSIFF